LVNWSAAGSNKLSIIELTVLAINKRRVKLVLLSRRRGSLRLVIVPSKLLSTS
jgi:hypothetical protein